jgi:hypothetical protein
MRDGLYDSGDVVSIRFGGVLRHYGVVTSRGTVICNSRLHGGVVEQSFEAFSAGRYVRLHGRYSDLDGYHVELRARRHLGKEYDLFGSNCGQITPSSTRYLQASDRATRRR